MREKNQSSRKQQAKSQLQNKIFKLYYFKKNIMPKH